jgi:hypothetical protein
MSSLQQQLNKLKAQRVEDIQHLRDVDAHSLFFLTKPNFDSLKRYLQ